jgi:hypothetical protein
VAPSETVTPSDPDEDRLAELYSGPLEDFVNRRNELARELGRAGEKEAAARIKALPKPVATAWVVNLLARQSAEDFAALREAGDEVRRAQAAGDREALRRTSDHRRELVGVLVERASALLREGGHQDSVQALQRVRRTLEAISAYGSTAALDPPVGRLFGDLEPPGFETLLAMPLATPKAPVRVAKAVTKRGGKQTAPATEASAAARKALAARRLELQKAATAVAERVEEARVAAREAEVAHERAARRAEDAERSVGRQEERLRDAQRARDAAFAQRREAEREAAAAAKLLEKRRAELAAAQAKLRDLA